MSSFRFDLLRRISEKEKKKIGPSSTMSGADNGVVPDMGVPWKALPKKEKISPTHVNLIVRFDVACIFEPWHFTHSPYDLVYYSPQLSLLFKK